MSTDTIVNMNHRASDEITHYVSHRRTLKIKKYFSLATTIAVISSLVAFTLYTPDFMVANPWAVWMMLVVGVSLIYIGMKLPPKKSSPEDYGFDMGSMLLLIGNGFLSYVLMVFYLGLFL